jgi:hypothetical protein
MDDLTASAEVRNCVKVKFLVPDWGDIVDSGIGLLYRPAGYIGRRAGTTSLYAYVKVDYIPQSGTKNLDTGFNPSIRRHSGI